MRKDYGFKSLVLNWAQPPLRLCSDVHVLYINLAQSTYEGGLCCDGWYDAFSVCGRDSCKLLYWSLTHCEVFCKLMYIQRRTTKDQHNGWESNGLPTGHRDKSGGGQPELPFMWSLSAEQTHSFESEQYKITRVTPMWLYCKTPTPTLYLVVAAGVLWRPKLVIVSFVSNRTRCV